MKMILNTIKMQRNSDIRYLIFRYTLLGGSLFSAVVLISYLFTRRPLVNTLTTIVLLAFCLLMYALSRSAGQYTIARICTYAAVGFLYVPFAYLTTPGSVSAMPFYVLLILFLFIVFAVHTWEYMFSILLIIEQNILFQFEADNPERFIPYESRALRYLDLSVNYSMIAIFIMIILVLVMRSYHLYSMTLLDRSVTDMLTGLYNKRYIEENAEYELNRCMRKGDHLCLMFIDLNNFKRINDTLGHQKGDKVLQDLAGIIKQNTRNYDVCARYGGDEFLILLPSTTKEEAREQVRRLDEAFTAYSADYKDQEFSVSFGIADNKDGNFEDLLKLADQRLYEDKRERKNLYTDPPETESSAN